MSVRVRFVHSRCDCCALNLQGPGDTALRPAEQGPFLGLNLLPLPASALASFLPLNQHVLLGRGSPPPGGNPVQRQRFPGPRLQKTHLCKERVGRAEFTTTGDGYLSEGSSHTCRVKGCFHYTGTSQPFKNRTFFYPDRGVLHGG